MIHENFLPALDRCQIILSRLVGLSSFHENRDDTGLSLPQLNRVSDIIECLRLVGNKILLLVMDQLDSFVAFSSWLRFTIDRLASSSTNEELTEKEATMDNSKAIHYIQKYLTKNPINIYFNEIAKEDYTSDWDHLEDGASLLEVLDKQLKKHESGLAHMKALPHVDFLVNYATSRSKLIFQNVASTLKRSVRFGPAVELPAENDILCLDIKIDKNNQKVCISLVLGVFPIAHMNFC